MQNVTILDFEGPLDLLLHLVKKSKMDINEIKIVPITEQYIKFIEEQEKLNLNVASEYLLMESELIETEKENKKEVIIILNYQKI